MRIGSIIPRMILKRYLKPLLYLKNYGKRGNGRDNKSSFEEV